MEALGLVILSMFALYGIFLSIDEFFKKCSLKGYDAGFKIILSIPENAVDKLEGVIRGIFSEEIPEKLLTDCKLYIAIPHIIPQIEQLLKELQRVYPIEVLPDDDRYCMITDRTSK